MKLQCRQLGKEIQWLDKVPEQVRRNEESQGHVERVQGKFFAETFFVLPLLSM